MIIGIDLGGTNIAAGLVDASGAMHHTASRPTRAERGFDAVAADMCALIDELATIAEARFASPVESIGIGIPGIADPHTGTVLACVNLGWVDAPLGSVLRKRYPYPVFIDNDATVAAAAEFLIAQRGAYRNAVLLTLGTGVGSGIMIDGKTHSGAHGVGAEIGHMIVGENFYDCNCGRNGCLETFVSSSAIKRYALHLLQSSPHTDSVLRTLPLDEVDGKRIFAAAEAGDAIALAVLDRMAKYLAKGIMNIVSVLDPEAVLLGGGLSLAGDLILERVRSEVAALRYFKNAPMPRIELAMLRNDAGIIGAAVYAHLKR